jgi:hypothetical protein
MNRTKAIEQAAATSGTSGRHAAGVSSPAKSDRRSEPSAAEFD